MSEYDQAFEARYQAAIDRARARSAALAGPSLAERLARLPAATREAILDELSTVDRARLARLWDLWARPKQNPQLVDEPHRVLFLLGGRGAGKTISGANRIKKRVEAGARSIAFIGPTLRDVQRYMIKGEGGSDGILTVFHPSRMPLYMEHKAMVFFHRLDCTGCKDVQRCGGAIAYVNSAEDPEFRGPNLDTVWCDEPAKWRYLNSIWSNIELATRLRGDVPLEIMLTGTPLPLKLFRELIADEDTVTILMSQVENSANLDPTFVKKMAKKYGGTRLGRQELEGEILTDNPDALFLASILDATRVESVPKDLEKAAIAIDPAGNTGDDNDETGIIGGGIDAAGHVYVWLDASGKHKPEAWGSKAVKAAEQNKIDVIVCERNMGGDMVASTVRLSKQARRGVAASASLKIVEVHATRGKHVRAEPVSALHEQGRLHIVGTLPELEGELTEWNPKLGGKSPNRLDAMVWLVHYLANLGEDEPADHRAGFVGLREVAKKIGGAPRRAGLSSLIPRSSRGSTL